MPAPKSWEQYKEECQPIAESKQIQILGWTGQWKGGHTKLDLLCHCGNRWQSTTIYKFKVGRGCPQCGWEKVGQAHSKTPEQHLHECREINTNEHWTINGIHGDWKGHKTKLDCTCDLHGRWYSTNINNFKSGRGCPQCANVKTSENMKKPDDEMIASFLAKREYPKGTIFKRSDRLTNRGYPEYWFVYCPICAQDEIAQTGLCSGWFESLASSLQKGGLACRCSGHPWYTDDQNTFRAMKLCEDNGYQFVGWVDKVGTQYKFKYLCPEHGVQIITFGNMFTHGQGCPECAGHSQQQLYINIVKDNDIIVALKFGIAKNSDRRLNIQNNRNMFFMERICLYDFSTVEQCKAAERAIKKKLKTGILTARELKDGYTETVSVSDLENLQKIITQYGGKLVYNKEV